MSQENHQWLISLLQERYLALNLTFEQAEKIYAYEQERDQYSERHYFSTWEEWDFERATFSEILDEQQQQIYFVELEERIRQYGQQLSEMDNNKINEIAYYEALINFYETQLLPDFFKDPILHFDWLFADTIKIDYLKAEYKRLLQERKREILVEHFRHNRIYKPNELKVSLLRHKLTCIFPDYTFLKSQMDEPTKAVVEYLKTKISFLPEKTEKLVVQKLGELREFNEANFKKYFEKVNGGWHVVVGQQTPEQEKENRIMTLLLLDKDQYKNQTITFIA